ncbi:MAG: ATP phosphoribosyltransferase regulatory subunit [Synergistaceae bacterium]|nr:ATP phosphoribosyltransferase regulatory subunit [Synergistaceae bacterium]
MFNPILTDEENYALTLRELYASKGCKFYRMSRFEEYDFYAGKKDFLSSGAILTFTDIDGRLMALRPDVTLSIIKHASPGKYYYYEKVYRPKASGSFREIPQCGIEFTAPGASDLEEVLRLAVMSLHSVADGRKCVLDVADAGLVAQYIPQDRKALILQYLSAKNIHGLHDINAPAEIIHLAELSGSFDGLTGLEEYGEEIRTDYSAVTTLSYYSGLVFKGYIEGIPEAVLSGGQYSVDGVSGVGFAVYLDAVTGGKSE